MTSEPGVGAIRTQRRRLRCLGGLGVAVCSLTATAAFAQQLLLVAEDATSAKGFPQVGRVVTFICPSSLKSDREIWGTDVYHNESPVCTAAVHAGVLRRATSGQVTILIGPGADSFKSEKRNDVASQSWGSATSTYTFVKNNEPAQIDWSTTYDHVPDDFTSPITVVCPPNGNADTYVWGEDVYTASSGICAAAVHAGAITFAGGRITVSLAAKQQTFVASDRNGVSTRVWTNWDFKSYGQPFTFKAAPGAVDVAARTDAPAPGARPQQDPGPPPSLGPHRINVVGFTAAGSASERVPRVILVKGFTATGTSTTLAPRSVAVKGWTAEGVSKSR